MGISIWFIGEYLNSFVVNRSLEYRHSLNKQYIAYFGWTLKNKFITFCLLVNICCNYSIHIDNLTYLISAVSPSFIRRFCLWSGYVWESYDIYNYECTHISHKMHRYTNFWKCYFYDQHWKHHQQQQQHQQQQKPPPPHTATQEHTAATAVVVAATVTSFLLLPKSSLYGSYVLLTSVLLGWCWVYATFAPIIITIGKGLWPKA